MEWALLKCFSAGIHTIIDETLFLGLETKEKAQSIRIKQEIKLLHKKQEINTLYNANI
jgi:hypothetical protein